MISRESREPALQVPAPVLLGLEVAREKQEPAAVGQEVRPDADVLLPVVVDDAAGLAALGGHGVDPRALGSDLGEEDRSGRAPARQRLEMRGVANRPRRPAREIHPLELAVREETQRPGVGRPERRDGSLGSFQHAARQRVEGAKVEPPAPRGAPDEDEVPSVGRERRLSLDIARLETHGLRKVDGETDQARSFRRAAPSGDQDAREGDGEERGGRPWQRPPHPSAPFRRSRSGGRGPAARLAQPLLERREVPREVARRGVPVVRRLREAPLHHPPQRRRRQRREAARSAPARRE